MKCFGQKKNTVETYFTNSSLLGWDSFPGWGGGGKIDTLFKTKILKNIPWLAARPH